MFLPQHPDSPEDIHDRGHRAFVGREDLWSEIGQLQFDLLIKEGLKPAHKLLDIGCGALRGGTKFVSYLDSDCYFGLDKHLELLIYGVALELGLDVFRQKRPRFVISDRFEFERFEFEKLAVRPDFALAQSLFTHLNEDDVHLCLSRLRPHANGALRLFATFFERDRPQANLEHSHAHAAFVYTRDQMMRFAEAAGWTLHYIGDWGHPRQQKLVELRPGV